MIRKLRWNLVAITMALLTVVLTAVMVFAYYSFSSGIRSSSMQTLQAAADAIGRPNRPGDVTIGGVGQCFLLELDRDGTLVAIGSEQFDLSDKDSLMELLEKAQATGESSDVLKDEQLRFLRVDSGPETKYVFMDISGELQTTSRLIWSYIAIYVAGLIVFFFISILLAGWAIRPVEQAWNQQRQFIADASHELKTPLTVILTNAELLSEPECEKEPFTGNILTMSQQMRGLVEELLEQARVDAGKTKPERRPLDMSKLASDAVLPFEPVYYEAGLCLDSQIHPGITVSGNTDQLRRVIDILLDNGCKYSTPGGTVLLRLTKHQRGCLLSVTSPGQELTEQQRTDVFKRFYRADAVRPMQHSYGLGLSIAKSLVEQHKGKIWVQSESGYNTFYVSLPL